MFQWIESHAIAVQSLTGIIGLLVAVIAIMVTWWNVRLTKAMAETSHYQLSALLQPIIKFELNNLFEGHSRSYGKDSYSLGPVTKIKNAGNAPIKMKRITLLLQSKAIPTETKEYVAADYSGRVLLPGEEITGLYDVETEINYGPVRDEWIASLTVECTDLSQVVVHTFSVHPQYGMFHSSTADRPVTFWRSLSEAARYIKSWAEFQNS